MDEKEEDHSEESLKNHLDFYKKLNKTILDIKNEINESKDSKNQKHLNERINAIELDKTRIKKMFPEVDDKIWTNLG